MTTPYGWTSIDLAATPETAGTRHTTATVAQARAALLEKYRKRWLRHRAKIVRAGEELAERYAQAEGTARAS